MATCRRVRRNRSVDTTYRGTLKQERAGGRWIDVNRRRFLEWRRSTSPPPNVPRPVQRLTESHASWKPSTRDEWINSPPLTAADLQGRCPGRVLDLHLHQLAADPSVHARVGRIQEAARRDRRTFAGVLIREGRRERAPGGEEMKIGYPIAVDNHYEIWPAFENQYWPALYFIDSGAGP